MNTIDIIRELRKLNVVPRQENGNIKLLGATSDIPDELLALVKKHKGDIIDFLKDSRRSVVEQSIPRVEDQPHFPLSHSQKRLWLLSQFEGGNKAYNISTEMFLKGEVHVQLLEQAIQKSIQRHEILRTIFVVVNDQPMQKILEEIHFQISTTDISQSRDKNQLLKEQIEDTKNIAFDLEKGPLIKVQLTKMSAGEYALFFSIHHIISDGWSMGLLIQEIMDNYKNLCLQQPTNRPPLAIHYRDYCLWLEDMLSESKGEEAKEFWLQKNLGEVSPLLLPLDFKRPSINRFEGAYIKNHLDRNFYRRLEIFARDHRTTIFNVYRAVLGLLLHKLSGQNQLIIGTPIAGRITKQLHDQIGLYVNTLPLRSDYDPSMSVAQYIKSITQDSIASFNCQYYPLDRIIEESSAQRDTSRNPLFDVLMVLQNTALGEGSINYKKQHGFTIDSLDKYLFGSIPMERSNVPAKFDLSFNFGTDPYSKQPFVEIEYRSKLFKKSTVQRFFAGFSYLLEQIVDQADASLGDLQITPPGERQKILQEFNQPISQMAETNVLDLLEESFASNANKTAILSGNQSFTYQELQEQSNGIALAIAKRKASPGHVAIFMERSEKVLFAIHAVLKAGGTFVPIDVNYPPERINYLLEDSQAELVLTDSISIDRLPNSHRDAAIVVENISPSVNLHLEREDDVNQSAYLIYTSGSTGRPKGVEITHGNVIAFLTWADKEFANTPYELVYAATSYCFDLSIFEMFLPLIHGKSLRILKSAVEIGDNLVHDQQVMLNTVPSVVRNLLAQQIDWDQVVALNMAGEPVPVVFRDQLDYHQMEVRNLYGPSEDTTYSTIYRFGEEQYDSVPIGRPVGDTQIYILDEHLNLSPIGVEGEICISGLSVAKGYFMRPDLTAEKFISNPFHPQHRLYKTGDIGRWRPDGLLEFVGRMDDQVKVRGHRIELGEIQYHLEQIDQIKQAVVCIKTVREEPSIVAYWEAVEDWSVERINAHLQDRLPAYMIPQYYLPLEEIPLNSNGKVDKKKLPVPQQTQAETWQAPTTELQEKLQQIWQVVLQLPQVGTNENFFELGGHSLKATLLRNMIERETGKLLSLNDIFQHPNILQQETLLQQRGKQKQQSITKTADQDHHPLSFAQERLWVLTKFEEASAAYHMPAAFRLLGEIDVEQLEKALSMVVEKYEILRSVFREIDGQPRQVVLPSTGARIKVERLDFLASDEQFLSFLKEDWRRPFDLKNGPLLRCSLLQTTDASILSFNMHHIISDGWSIGVLYKELVKAYGFLQNQSRTSLPLPGIQYKDFAIWQRNTLTEEVLTEQTAYWCKEVFSDGIPVLELPTDAPRPTVKTYNGATLYHSFDKAVLQQLQATNQSEGASLFMGLLANVFLLIKKWSNQDDITIGTPVAGRDMIQLQDQIGFFINTLPIRTKLDGEATYADLLQSVKQNVLKAFDYQYFPFERLIEELQPKRDLSRSPLFDMMVVLQNAFDPVAGARQSDGLPLEQMQVTSGITKYDLTFSFAEDKDRLLLELEYNTDLFKEQTVKRLLTYLEQLFATSSQHKNLALKNISLVDEQTTKGLLAKLDRTAVSYDAEANILSHFETVVNRFPDRKALSVGDQDWTYQQLDEWSGKLAHKLLQERGVQREELIALHMSRSHWMIVAIMGVLKAGAAYVPIDPEYPDARKEFILEDSGCRLVLSDGPVQEGTKTREGQEWIDLSSEDWDVPTASTSVDPHNLAYVIYTSGTTGQPKGVLIEHRHVSRLLFNDQPLFDFDQYDRWTLFHSYCFDFSVWEIFGALLHGAQLFVVPKGVSQDALSFYDFLADHRISVLNQTPSAFRSLSMLNENRFDAQPLAVRYLVFGGEALMPSWLEAWQDAFDNCRIVNMYGITETTVHVTYKEITAVEIQANKSNIGLPIPTLSCFVLDRDLQPVVPGVIGELCVGGAGVARGYLNRDELTKEKFIAHPLHPEQRIYRSGDFARLLPNGDLEYIGRKDAQVKIRGHRIETGEIESIIKNQADIRDAVVRVYQNQQGENELVAYVILQEELEFDRSVMRNQLRDALPAYMLPSHLLQLTELPLTANGKLDVTALPSPDRGGADERSYAAPRNETDEQIIAIWKEVLEKETIGINDNFFDLGGHSLKATRVISALQEQFGVSIDIKNMFIEPTVAYLSDYIATLQWMNEAEEVELSSSEEETRLIL